MLRIGEPAPAALTDAVVLPRDAREVAMGSFWADRPCLLIFLRQFGCVACSVEVSDISPRLVELARAGLRTVLVGNGPPDSIAAFARRSALDDKRVEIVTDP